MNWGVPRRTQLKKAKPSEGTRAPPRALEEAQGMALMQWAKTVGGMYPSLVFLHHIPNGGLRSKAVAAKMKAQGVKRGVWDYFLPVPASIAASNDRYNGIYIELKDTRERHAKNGGLSDEQIVFGEFVQGQGFATVVAYEWTEAQQALGAYLNGQPIPFFWSKVQHGEPSTNADS